MYGKGDNIMSSPLKVRDLKKALSEMDDDLEVYIRSQHACGNIKEAGVANIDTYGFFGKSVDCVIIEPYDWEDEEDEEA